MHCAICLDDLDCDIGLLPCEHIYHHLCIKEWSLRTNNCPNCRAKFNTITVKKSIDCAAFDCVIQVEDCVARSGESQTAETDAATHAVLLEYSRNSADYSEDDIEFCAVCGSSDPEGLIFCNECARMFHVSCARSDFCPSCEELYNRDVFGDQEYRPRSRRPRVTRPRLSATALAVATAMAGLSTQSRHPRSRTTSRGSRTLGTMPLRASIRSPQQRPHVITRQEQMGTAPAPVSMRPLVESSPSLPPLSRDEIQAWEMLDRAIEEQPSHLDAASSVSVSPSGPDSGSGSTSGSEQACATTSASSAIPPSGAQTAVASEGQSLPDRKLKRPSKRRRQGQPLDSEPVPSTALPVPGIEPATGAPTTVQSLLSDIRSGSPTKVGPPQFTLTTRVSTSRSVSPLGSPRSPGWAVAASPSIPGSPMSLDIPLSPAVDTTNGDDAAADNSPFVAAPSPPLLSLSSKEEIQKLVRDVLRPMYREGRIDKDQYTVVNRRVSRRLYDLVANDQMSLDGTELRNVANDYVFDELQLIL